MKSKRGCRLLVRITRVTRKTVSYCPVENKSRCAIIWTMTKGNDNIMLQWRRRWRQVGVELEQMRREEIRHANTRQALENLDDVFESVLRHHQPRLHSGFEEQQALFHRGRS